MIDIRVVAALLLPRVCPVCGEEKYLNEFHANWRCAKCESKRHKELYRQRKAHSMIETRECRAADHIDVGPLSALGDFYTSRPNVCRVCHKRHTRAATLGVTERMRVGQERQIGKLEESAAESARKLRDFEVAYALSPSDEVIVSEDQGGFSSLMSINPFLVKMQKRTHWGTY